MNVWIASDIHGSALYCRKLLDLMEKRGRTAWCCWGPAVPWPPERPAGGIRSQGGLCHAEQREGPDPLCPRQL